MHGPIPVLLTVIYLYLSNAVVAWPTFKFSYGTHALNHFGISSQICLLK